MFRVQEFWVDESRVVGLGWRPEESRHLGFGSQIKGLSFGSAFFRGLECSGTGVRSSGIKG